ncbi:preprotein translocase subunit YajC [Mucilaginibacter lappiensis]|uniref:Sec translocon accessory complex subunit YajC n=1 Tax=Mucilaginibacter lappiensis TaxID=354630 RepID=A0A1N7FLR5_9SPHI|nr:preprotein translocase subunit YajC [Mucilaginibacter lappiensis]MBB6112378.1 preprotein translocase subunit YajC [Mucilaginibacter lappiensis]MBB6127104.1 preprotein translocase subunit YajC [Mucilaginibacter lappiensis]SIS01207.1 protein translocase subunit yajC [Mucilaginibacter lappiensis]
MITTILLQAPAGGSGGFGMLIPMVLIIVVFYFFMIRPQVKKQKDQKKYVEELKKGDKVVTTAGIHGRIIDLNDTTFLVEVENGKIRFDKSAVSLDASKALNTPPVAVKS